MSDFFDSAKNFVNSAVSRTGWEANKQLRIRSKQGEIDKLLEQRGQLTDELIQTAMNLYQQGSLSDTQLSRLCASIFELDHDLRNREQQMQEVKNEPYPADQFAQNQPTNYAPPSANPYSAGNPYSGAPNANQNQNAGPYSGTPNTNQNAGYGNANPGSTAGAQGQISCPNCHQPVRAGSLYCRNCGSKVS